MARRPLSDPLLLAAVLICTAGLLAFLIIAVSGEKEGRLLLPATGARMEIVDDPGRRLDLPAILALPESDWRPWTRPYYVQGAPGGAVWARVTLTNPGDRPLRGVLADDEFIADRIDCWTRDAHAAGGWTRQTSGEEVPGVEKPIWGRDAAFYVDVPARGEAVVYLHARDHFTIWFLAAWWPDARAFLAAQLRHTLAEAVYFGVIAALLCYNGMLYVRLRHRDLGRYLKYLSTWAAFMAIGRGQHMLLGVPLGSPHLEPLVTALMAGGVYFLIQFAREFLGLSVVAPRLDRIARALGWMNLVFVAGAASLLWSRTSFWMHIVVPGVTLSHCTLLAAAFVAWRAGVGHARFFILCFGFFILGSVPFVARWLLAIPLDDSALWMLTGSALEMMLLSLALGDRFARLEHDSHAAQLAEEKARLESLRYQLNPHFLFNALNSIYGLVYPHSSAAGDLVRRLADFCRDTLTRPGGRWQPLGDEIAMLRNYLGIEQARWRESLRVEFDLDPAADDFLIPPFLLLPLMDNAIKHGGASSPDLLTVRLSTRREDDGAVTLTLVNSGFWETRPSGAPRASTSTGVGLENIRARLRHAFGAGHSLTTRSADGWVTVELRLPAGPANPLGR